VAAALTKAVTGLPFTRTAMTTGPITGSYQVLELGRKVPESHGQGTG
jgi:hypothetical protein